MGVFGLFIHLLNFVLPALVMALLLPLCVRWTPLGRKAAPGVPLQILVLAIAHVIVLVAGMLIFGRDGKMVTYLSMAVVGASIQWLLLRAWSK